jgi:hypothetical protein
MKRFVVALLLAVPALASAQVNTTTVIMGRVTVAGGGALPYASITINGKNAQFTDSLGRFQIEGISAGNVTLRSKRIGFTPAEERVFISRGDTVRVTLQMTRLAIRLPTMQTVARPCENPGAPGRNSDEALVQLYGQLVQNAENFRLLSQSHPYTYAMQRQFVTTFNDSVIERSPLEALTGTSARSWDYQPGRLVIEQNGKSRMNLPTLATFAEEDFAKTHCFWYGGEVEVEGQSLVRVDFAPDAKLRDPDVSGSIFLDPRSYQIRRAEVQLTKVPHHLSGQMTGHTVTTWFTEVMPGVPIVGAFKADVMKPRPGEVVTELYQVVHVNFPNGKP